MRHCALPGAAVLGAALLTAAPAHADYTAYAGNGPVPSVNLELRVDVGFQYLTNVDGPQYNGKSGTTSVLQGAGNDWGTSLYGMSGTSIISPDLSAVYRFEGGFNAANGQTNGSALVNRRAYVGLSNPQLGTLLIGKDLFIDNDIYNFDPMTQQNASTSTLVLGRNWQGSSDMIEYRSPTIGGFKIGAQGASGGNVNSNQTFNEYGVSAQFTLGELNLYAIGDDVHDAKGHFSSIYNASREGIFGATYQFGPVEGFAGYEVLSAPDAKASNPLSTSYSFYKSIYPTSANQEWIGADWQVSKPLLLQAAWFHTNVNKGGGSANLIAGGATYNLNKYIFVYTTLADLMNHGNADFAASIYSPPPPPGTSQFVAYSGMGISF
jgi:predicted porin